MRCSPRPRQAAFALAVLALAASSPAGAAPGSEDASSGWSAPPPWTIRLAGGAALPLADLANDDPRQGWLGGQSTGFSLAGGIRIPLMRDLHVRPELSFYGFGNYHDPALPVLVFDGSGADPDTVTGDWTRTTRMGGLRVHLDYIPDDRGTVSPFLTGGLGLVYMRLEDDFRLEELEDVQLEEDTLGLSASLGLGLLVGAFEVVVAGTFQEPGFTDIGAVSWFTADLSVGYSIPFRR